MSIAQTLGQDFRLELDFASEALDHSSLPYPRFADQHRGVRPLAMAKYLDYLPDLFVASDDWRKLVLARQLIQAHSKVLEIRRQLIAAAVFFFLLFMTADAGRYLSKNHLAVSA